ncbi:MAG: M23 family metallopeptidase [Candidatus Marinimicrobia bacterium]|nr:M23 family metallopeptidase [Candidatus Neomarinimicrobiota bacterium]
MKKQAKIVLFWNTKRSPKSLSLTQGKLIGSVVFAVLLVAVAVTIGINAFSNSIYNAKVVRLKKNNSRLVGTMYDLDQRIQQMESELHVLAEKDQALRTYVDIPVIDRDVRKLGIGGKYSFQGEELDNLLPNNDVKISKLATDLNRLTREIKLERISYEEIYNAIKHRSPQIKSTPSIRPINTGYISDGYGYRRDPFTGTRQFHYGIDISSPTGTPVYATADGVVRSTNSSGTYGKIIKVDHGYGYSTFYAHLSKIVIKPGDVIKRGQKIAEVGCTGRSTASHLHYEIRQFGINKNPLDYYFTGYIR